MSETLKVFGAMLALGEFTVDELSKLSGVKPRSVRSVIDRLSSDIETVKVEKTNRPGGQRRRRRLRREAIPALRARIDDVARSLDAVIAPGVSVEPEEFPLSFRLAEDILQRLIPEAKSDEERLDLLKMAGQQLRRTRTTPGSDLQKLVQEHTATVAAMREELVSPRPVANVESSTVEPIDEVQPNPEAEPLSVQLWTVPETESTTDILRKRIHNPVVDIVITPLPKRVAEERPLDGVILFVDSDEHSATDAFHRAIDLCRKAKKPLVVFDRMFDSHFRNTVIGARVEYVSDAETLDYGAAFGVLAKALNRSIAAPHGFRGASRKEPHKVQIAAGSYEPAGAKPRI